jgi:hypothetical protein
MRRTVKAIVEGGNPSKVNGKPYYTVRMEARELNPDYWIMGDGYSVEEAVKDFLEGYQEVKEAFAEHGDFFQELFFEFEITIPYEGALPDYLTQNRLKPAREVQIKPVRAKQREDLVFA